MILRYATAFASTLLGAAALAQTAHIKVGAYHLGMPHTEAAAVGLSA